MNIDLSRVKKVHFIGIGGIGISAIARLFLRQGATVSGSNNGGSSPILRDLRRLGAKIFTNHRIGNLTKDTELVIYTIAISPTNPELLKAKKLGIKTVSYPEFLGWLSRSRSTVAIAGTHGKTTTTAMIADILLKAKKRPMVIVGSLLNGRGSQRSNFVSGDGPLVVEACEYRRSFLNLSPKILVITNIDNDHLDYFSDLHDIQSAFAELAAKLPVDGALICDVSDRRLLPAIQSVQCQVIDYRKYDRTVGDLKLKTIGGHNRLNAAAALAVADYLQISKTVAMVALEKFRGTWRRLEYLGRTRKGAKIYDDYGHHPTAIRATLAAVRQELKPRRLSVIFQPHLHSRTAKLFKEFSQSFFDADQVFILPIYEARASASGQREKKNKEFSAQALAEIIPRAKFLTDLRSVKKETSSLGVGDIVLTIGAGDVFVLGESLRYNRS